VKDQKRDAIIFFLISGLFICVLYFFYHPKPSNQKLKGNFEVPAQWLDSMLQTMSVEEKMAQLYLWEVDSVKSVQEADSILLIVKNIKPAGLIVSNGFFLNKSFADTSLVPLIWGFKNKNGFEYQNIIPHFPSLQNIERITNKQVLKQFYSYCALEAVSAGYHYYFQPLKFSDKAFMPDSLLYKQNMLTASALLQSYFDTLNVQNSVNSVAISSFLDSNFVKINGLALRVDVGLSPATSATLIFSCLLEL